MTMKQITLFGLFGLALTLMGCGQNTDKNELQVEQEAASSSGAKPSTVSPASQQASQQTSQGQALYASNCLSCHQANGGGVPNMQPALVNSSLLSGAKPQLIKFVLTAQREGGSTGEWLGVMPPFSTLSDAEIASILTYARSSFVIANAVSAAEVASIRQAIVN